MQTFYFQIVHRHVFEGLKVEFDTIAEGGFNKFAIHKNITVVFKTDGKFLIYNTFFVSATTLQQSLYCFLKQLFKDVFVSLCLKERYFNSIKLNTCIATFPNVLFSNRVNISKCVYPI